LFDNAQKMIKDIIKNKWLEARGIIAFYPANTVDHEDIEVYSDESKTTVLAKFHTLRQQLDRD